MKEPKVGDKVYIGTSIRLSGGVRDVYGGICIVSHIEMGRSAGKDVPFVEVAEHPGHKYNWEYLMENQGKWERRFGLVKGCIEG